MVHGRLSPALALEYLSPSATPIMQFDANVRDLQVQVRNDRGVKAIDTHQARAKDKLVLGV